MIRSYQALSPWRSLTTAWAHSIATLTLSVRSSVTKNREKCKFGQTAPEKNKQYISGSGQVLGFFFPPLLLSLSCCLSVEPPFLGLALMHIKDKHLRHGRGCHSPPDNCWYIHSPESVIVLVFLLSNPCLLPSSPVCLLATESPLPSLGSSLPIYYPSYVFYFKSNK